jgi:SAM-dependent methyltransferase
MRKRLTAKVATARVPVEVTGDTAESLRHADASFDAVVFTLVLCSVNSQDRALAGARRVLRPSGRLIVLEHVRGSGGLSRWQDRLTPVWSLVNAGCRLNRDIATAIEHAGFTIEKAESFDPLPPVGTRPAPPGGHRRAPHLTWAFTQMENGNPAWAEEVPLSWSDRAYRSSRRSRLMEHFPSEAGPALVC